ncbi:MAG: hypothetical protein CR976_00405 [Thiotrichales bacterium]|nr:MAG: hypothetical protein CR976_00405 [Thiotrichales bacterium]
MYFFERAFRPFFLGGSLFAAVSMLVWWLNYPIAAFNHFSGVPSYYWHAHEMIFGYSLATVTGFLLTAVMNWTGENSASGKPLMLVFFCWVLARLGFLFGVPLPVIAIVDMAFVLGLSVLFIQPIIRTKQWKQMGLAAKFFLLLISNGLFYAGALGWLQQGIDWGMTTGLFLVLAINLTMMRRVVPFFTTSAIRNASPTESKLIDIAAIVGFLSLMIAALIAPNHWSIALIAFPLAAVHGVRAWWWYDSAIWKHALLWPLHLSYYFMTIGIAMYGFVGLGMINESLAEHALAAGGIGLLCSAMMARISLGHTGRNVHTPPKPVLIVFGLLAIAAVIRVLLPIVFPTSYIHFIHLAQWAWVVAFLLLFGLYWKVLSQPRPA